MRSHVNLWPRVTSFKNLYEAFRRARKGKRTRVDVAEFEYDLERNLLQLQRELLDETYRPGGYRHFVVHEPVPRKISAAPFRDRVVHHALCAVIEPLFDRVFLPDSFANRTGKGTHRALDCCRALVKIHPYVLKADVSKFFPSVDHEILFASIAGRIRCAPTRRLIRLILASGDGVLADEYIMTWFPGDTLLSPLARARGLPIGNLTSQFWAAQPRAGLDEADRELATLRIYLRLACELKFYSVGQYEHAARLVDELGRLVGGWTRRLDGVTATTAPRGRAVGAGSRPAGRILEQQPDEPTSDEPQRQHAGQPEQQHRVPLRE